MRDQPEAVRLTVATLYIRMRDARRQRFALLQSQGSESIAYISADAALTEAWNGLQVVLSRVHGERLRHQSAKAMLSLIARRNQIKAHTALKAA